MFEDYEFFTSSYYYFLSIIFNLLAVRVFRPDSFLICGI